MLAFPSYWVRHQLKLPPHSLSARIDGRSTRQHFTREHHGDSYCHAGNNDKGHKSTNEPGHEWCHSLSVANFRTRRSRDFIAKDRGMA